MTIDVGLKGGSSVIVISQQMAVHTYLLVAIVSSTILLNEGVIIPDCQNELGLRDRTIGDNQISGSSQLSTSYPATGARLNNNGAWCAKSTDRAYLTIDLKGVKSIFGVKTQGFVLPDSSAAPTEAFTIAISTDGIKFDTFNETKKVKVFQGSKEANSIITNNFKNHVMARYVRIFPRSSESNPIVCLRLEIIGCDKVLPPTIDLQSQGSASVGKLGSFACTVTAQRGVIVSWRDKSGTQVDKKMIEIVTESKGQLQVRQAAILKVNASASDVMKKSGKYVCEVKDSNMQCRTIFQCVAEYNFNKTLTRSKNITVVYTLVYPKPPNAVEIAKRPGGCTFSFSLGSPGSFPSDSLEYKIIVNVSGGPLQRFPIDMKTVDYTGFRPFTLYEFDISVGIKPDVWTTKSFKKLFHSYAQAPDVSPDITRMVPSGSTELHVYWEEPKYKPANGIVSKYRLMISQFDYGGKRFPINGLQPIKRDIDNITARWDQYIIDDLKEWSRYNITLFAYNNDGQTDTKGTKKSAMTGMGKPSAAPQNIKVQSIGARYAVLSWQKPPFLKLNGDISAYYASVTLSQKKGRRKRRSGEGFIKILKTPYRFVDLKPFTQYSIEIAAGTSGIGIFSKPVKFQTNQAAPSIPANVRFSRDPKDNTWIIFWDSPKETNGIISLYAVEIVSNAKTDRYTVNGEITSLESKVNTEYGLKIRIRARTVEFGDWSEWIVKAPLPFIPTKPPDGGVDNTGKEENQTLLIIIFIFLVLIFLVLVLMIGFFILYRRRYKKMALKVELQMDKIMKPPYDNPEGDKWEKEKLVRTDSIDQNTDNTGSIEDKAHPLIKAGDFLDYVKKMRENEDEKFLLEYKYDLMSGKRYPCETASRPENKPKNRYANITAYDHSRVVLKLDSSKRKNETDYINANTVQGYSPESSTRYIASHGPTESVSSDFWRMIWQEGSNVIVMLTKLEEGRKVKCFQYWPTIGSAKYGHITVTILSTDQTADYYIRSFELSKGSEMRTLRQFHFVSWPDHGVPEFPTSLLSLRRRVRHYHKESAPMIVHCSAGVGRTGCFILIDAMLERLDNDGNVDLFNYLQYMRTRRINMVQTLDQYIFAHDAVLEYILCGNTEISVSDLERRIKELKRGSGMEEEFMIVETTSPDPDTLGNIFKVLLKIGRFVDASYVDGYKQRDAFILCRSPSQDFVEDFWTMVKEKKVHTIVMLNQLEENKKFCKYWPDLHEVEASGTLRVCLTSEARNGNIMSRKIKLLDESDNQDGYEVQHFQFLDWPDHGVPTRRNSLLTLMSLVEKSQQQFGNGPILVHCSNGHGRSGTFASVYNTTERLKVEQLIDVLQCVRAIRLSVPNAVDNLEQYQFIYNMIRTFLEAFATYSNFER